MRFLRAATPKPVPGSYASEYYLSVSFCTGDSNHLTCSGFYDEISFQDDISVGRTSDENSLFNHFLKKGVQCRFIQSKQVQPPVHVITLTTILSYQQMHRERSHLQYLSFRCFPAQILLRDKFQVSIYFYLLLHKRRRIK